MSKRQVELVFDDAEIGCPEFGFIKRDPRVFLSTPNFDEGALDDEDKAYQEFLAAKGIKARVADAIVYID
jgi:hypothetical protein